MNDESVRRLEQELSVEAGSLAGLEPAPVADLDQLATLVSAAIAREDNLVSTSLDAAIGALPRPLRGRARTLLQEDS